MNGNFDLIQSIQYFFCLSHFIRSAMRNDEVLVGFYCGFILKNAVPGDADTIKTCAQSAETSTGNCSFEAADNGCHQGAARYDWSNARDDKKSRAEQDAPECASECAQLSPLFHSVTGIIIADHIFFGMIVLAHNGQFFHVIPGFL